jgi:hypothetical protein
VTLPLFHTRPRPTPEIGDAVIQKIEPGICQPQQPKPQKASKFQRHAGRVHTSDGGGFPIEHRPRKVPQASKREVQ